MLAPVKRPKRIPSKRSSWRRRRGRRRNLGIELLERFESRISTGWEDLERFEWIDEFIKPLVGFGFWGGRKVFLELEGILKSSGYAYFIATKSGKKVNEISKKGSSSAYVYVSKFPKLIKFISKHGSGMPNDLWGLLFGYPLDEVYQFTYENDAWRKDHFGLRRSKNSKVK